MAPCEPLKVSEVIERLTAIVVQQPEIADWPVRVIDMEDENEPEQPWDGLVTLVETDCVSQMQGLVVSLLAWRSMSVTE
jgi:hypothetical protein